MLVKMLHMIAFKNFWYGVFTKLCKKYNKMDYFRKTIH